MCAGLNCFLLCNWWGGSFWTGLRLFGRRHRRDSCLFPLVAPLYCERRQGANPNNTIAFERKLGEPRASLFWTRHTHTHSAWFLSCHNCFFFTALPHTSLQPSTTYIAKMDAIKWSWTWQALRVVYLQMIVCHNMFLNFFLNYHEKHKVRKKIVTLSLRNYHLTRKL